MKKLFLAIALAIVSTSLLQVADAHHSFAVFFNTRSKLVKVTGVVQDFQFSNPHGVITLLVPKGRRQIIWRAETNSPSVLRRRGWSPDSLHVGDTVTLEGWPARDGTRYMRLRAAILANGQPVGKPIG